MFKRFANTIAELVVVKLEARAQERRQKAQEEIRREIAGILEDLKKLGTLEEPKKGVN